MHHLTKEDITAGFRQCGIRAGDILMLHSDAIVLSQLPPMPAEDRYALLFKALDEVLGPEGTLVIPTFTYSAPQEKPFLVDETPSSVGVLTEYFRNLPGVYRSRDPIFSIAARGARAKEFASVEIENSFGPNSAFDLLYRNNGWIASLGCPFVVTFAHYVEQKANVPYRYFKTFSGEIQERGQTTLVDVSYFVRDLNQDSKIDWPLLRQKLAQKDILFKAAIGRVGLCVVRSRFMSEEMFQILSTNPYGLLRKK